MVEEDFYGVLKGVRSLWEDKMLLDYIIEVEDKEFRVHKVILATTSDYFKTMLTTGMAESRNDRVRLEGLSALAVENMIQLMYKGEFCATKPDIEELVEAAMYLQMPGAIDDCNLLLAEVITPQNCFKLLSMLQTYSATDCIQETIEYIKSHFEEVYEAWKPGEMTYTDIETLVDLWQKSEWDLFLAIKHWVDVDIEDRLPHLNELMNRVRFGLMTPEQVEAIQGSDLYSGSDGAWCENVAKALKYLALPTHAKVLDDSEQSRVKDNPHPFFFNSITHQHYQFRQDTSWTGSDLSRRPPMERMTWQRCRAVEMPEIRPGIDTIVVVNNFLILCEQYNMGQNLHILDPRTMKWSPMARTNKLREHSALVYCNKHLYFLGGRPRWMLGAGRAGPTDMIERYDFETNTWSIISSRLPVAVYNHATAVIDDCIYVAGGWMQHIDVSRRLDCFDTTTNTWHSKAKVPDFEEAIITLRVMEYCNEKIFFTMCRHLEMAYYSPAQDQWFIWRCAESLRDGMTRLVWHEATAVLTDQKHTLFLLNYMQRHPNTVSNHDSEDDEDTCYMEERVCRKWTVSPDGKEIFQKQLQEFPVPKYGKFGSYTINTRLMLLAVQPQPTAALSML